MRQRKGTQKEQVIAAMEQNGGYATLQQLNSLVDVSTWKTQTPFASIRRIVQSDTSVFFKIRPGLWALKRCENDVMQRFSITAKDSKSNQEFTHGYYQGVIVQLGNLRHVGTYIPAQDKNRLFLETRLIDLVSVKELPAFTYDQIMKKARTVDVIWFNERNMPNRFYEVEHTTNIQHSLDKFFELQDFRAEYYIIADQSRRREFDSCLQSSLYNPIRDYVRFFSYESLVRQYESEISITDRI